MIDDRLLKDVSSDGVMTLIMNRPECHNAFDDIQIQGLIDALDAAERDDSVKVVVLAGNGKSFSAGGDIQYMRRMGGNSYEQNLADAARLAELMKKINFFSKPTIARVQGAAMGGGVGLVCCCDIAIGSTRAKLALSEIKIGMVPATIAPYVVQTIGQKAARRLFMTGESIDAENAFRLGLLSEVVDEQKLDARISEVATVLLQNAPSGLNKAKQIIRDVAHGDIDDEMISRTVSFIADIRHSEEGKEGLNAFLEKRRPNW